MYKYEVYVKYAFIKYCIYRLCTLKTVTPSSTVINLSRDSNFNENRIYRYEFANNKDVLFDLFYSTIFYNVNYPLISKLVSKVPLIIPAFWCSHQSRVTKLTTELNSFKTCICLLWRCFISVLFMSLRRDYSERLSNVSNDIKFDTRFSLLVFTGISSIPSFRIELVACEWIFMPYFRAYVYFALKNIINCL